MRRIIKLQAVQHVYIIRILWALIIVSFISKLAIGYILRDTFFLRGNSYSFLNMIAVNLTKNSEFSVQLGIPSIDYEPLYSFLMAAGYGIFGINWLGITLFQAILFALTTWLLFMIGAHLKNETSAIIAAAYHSFYPPIFFHSLSVFDTTLFIFLFMLMLYLVVVRVREGKNYWTSIFIGIATGFGLLCRGSILFILPPIFVYLIITLRSKFPKLVISLLLIVASFLLVISPWVIRNYYYTESLVITTHGGFGFWQGNNAKTIYYLKNNISLDRIYQEMPPPLIYQKYPIQARPPKEAIAVDRFYKYEAIRYIKNNPKEFVKLSIIKFIKFWSFIYNPISDSYAYGNAKSRQCIYFFSYFPLLLALPFGLIYFLKRSRSLFVLFAGIFVCYTLAHMVIMGYTRLRLPLDPILMLLLGIVVTDIFFQKDI